MRIWRVLCECSEESPRCVCGFQTERQLWERMWRTTSQAEADEIKKELNMTRDDWQHPHDINQTAQITTFAGDRHQRYPAYVWDLQPGDKDPAMRWRWVVRYQRGN